MRLRDGKGGAKESRGVEFITAENVYPLENYCRSTCNTSAGHAVSERIHDFDACEDDRRWLRWRNRLENFGIASQHKKSRTVIAD